MPPVEHGIAHNPIKFSRLVWAAPLAAVMIAAAAYGTYSFPVVPILLGVALIGYAAILWREPRLWLFFVPALAPVLNLAPWSGRFFFDEVDLFFLVTVAIGSLRIGSGRPARLAPVAAFLISALVVVYIASAVIGISPLESMDSNAFANYYSRYNGLRMSKSLAWAIAFLFLARADLGSNAKALSTYWVPGVLVGLAGVVSVAIWERIAFPGLTNFSENYRVTATFGSMHVGGGAIDGYLALALPFTLLWLNERRPLIKVIAAAALLALGSYTIMVTFSRGLYVACIMMIFVLAFGAMVRQKATGVFSTRRALLVFVTVILMSALCFAVFASGGYRSLAAILGFIALGFFLGRKAEVSGGGAVGIPLAITLIIASLALIQFFAKGAYIAYAITFLIGFIGVALTVMKPRASKHRLAWSGFLATAVVTPFVGKHWGGMPAMWAALSAVLFVLVLVSLNRIVKRPLWRPNVRHASMLAFVSLIFFMSVPIAGNSYFVSTRFSDRSGAVRDRMVHWQDTLNMMDNTLATQFFGMGVGRFPALFFWRSPRTAPPGTFTLMEEPGNTFLRLGGTHDSLGGVTLYYAQRISPEPYRGLIFSFDVRTTFPKARVQAGLCESLLLYSENCETKILAVQKNDGSWQRMEIPLQSRNLGAWHRFGKKPVQAWLVNPIGGTHIDIDNVRLTDASGNNLLKNGEFNQGGDHWLFSVSNFWPWHIESIWVHTFFEQGWLGLILLVLLIGYAACRLLMLVSRGQLIALAMLVSLAGFVTVGTFNSLFEFPRVAVLFYLMLFMALIKWSDEPPRVASKSSRSNTDEQAIY